MENNLTKIYREIANFGIKYTKNNKRYNVDHSMLCDRCRNIIIDVHYGHPISEYDLCQECYNELTSKNIIKKIGTNSDQKTYDHLYKIIIIGDSNVGKTNLINRWIKNEFCERSIPTIGVEFVIKVVEYRGKKIKLQIWDTAGQDRYKTILSSYYKESHGVILVYDINNKKTFDNLDQWYSHLIEHTGRIPAILVGNKNDLMLSRQVSIEEAKKFADKINISFFEISVLQNININEVFSDIIIKVYNYNTCTNTNTITMENNINLIKNNTNNSYSNSTSINMFDIKNNCCVLL